MRRPRNLSPEEKKLWDHFARGVTPKAPNRHTPISEADKAMFLKADKHLPKNAPANLPHKPLQKPVRPAPHHQAVNGTVARQLRRGRADIDMRIDLHGMRQAEAHSALNMFILSAQDKGARCVLVITGKGTRGAGHKNPYETPGPGVLRTRLRQWVAQDPLRSICYGIEESHPKHGGAGAFYVFIRKKTGTR